MSSRRPRALLGLVATLAYVVFEGSLIGVFAYFTQSTLDSWFGISADESSRAKPPGRWHQIKKAKHAKQQRDLFGELAEACIGDQLVRVAVETPSRLTSDQKEALRRFAEVSGDDVHPQRRTFLEKVRELFGS